YRDLERLTERLQAALGFPEEQGDAWVVELLALLEPAASAYWSVEARLLYDLQKVCVDLERPVYAVDLVEWFVSWFRRPVKRLLPDQGPVLAVRHLRSALARVPAARVAEDDRARLGALLHGALERAEAELRDVLRPKVHRALDEVGLVPENAA